MTIHVGVGGWNFAPWRGTYFPPGLPHAQELAHSSRRLTAIEVNATFYRTQTPDTFRRWAAETPGGFVFTVKAARGAAQGRDPAAAIARFLASGLTELGDKLGPILWQLPPTRRFDPDPLEAFLALLPNEFRHALEARHPSFADPACLDLLRRRGIARVIVDSDKHPLLGDLTAPFVYARLQRNTLAEPEGYATPALDAWAARLRRWSTGKPVTDLPLLSPPTPPTPRTCFAYCISGDKIRAPDAALALLARL